MYRSAPTPPPLDETSWPAEVVGITPLGGYALILHPKKYAVEVEPDQVAIPMYWLPDPSVLSVVLVVED